MRVTWWRRVLYGVWATAEVLLFGGLGYGWPALVFLLKQRRVYSDLCRYDVIKPLRHKNSSATNSSEQRSTATMSSILLEQTNSTVANLLPIPHVNSMDIHDSQTKTSGAYFSYKVPDKNVSSFVESFWENSTDLASNELDQALNCDDQDAAFALGYAIVTALAAIGSVGIGHAQRSVGMRLTRIGSGLIYIAGLLMVGFVTPERPALVITGMTSVTLAGMALLMTNVQLGALYGRARTTFVGLLSGCFDVSAIMQLLIKMVITSGADYLLTYVGVAALNCLTLVSASLWLPKGPVLEVTEKCSERKPVSDREATQGPRPPAAMTSYVTSPKLLSSLTSPLYVLHVLWFSFLQLRLFFFVGDLNRWLTKLAEDDLQLVDHYTNVQLYTGCSSVLFAMLAGCLYDWQRHRLQASPSRERRYLRAAVLPLLAATSACCVLSVLSLLTLVTQQRHVLLYVTFLLLAAFRSCLYSLAAAFVAVTFPQELFGVLYGGMVICGGVVGSLMYPLFIWSEAAQHSVVHVNIFLLGTSLLTYAHPLHILWRCRLEPLPPGTSSQADPGREGKGAPEKERMMNCRDDSSSPACDYCVHVK